MGSVLSQGSKTHYCTPNFYYKFMLQDFEAPRISRISAHEGGKVVSPMHRPPLSPGEIPGTISIRG
jgi:hypothetical protein